MTVQKDWNPELYLRFKNERTQPSIDLVSRIELEGPHSIIDIGCGPGNSTQILVRRWPNALVSGLDSSAAMIDKARLDYPQQKWLLGDAGNLEFTEKYSLVYSSATLQWIPNHQKLVVDLLNLTENDGVLAVQIPAYQTMPLSHAVDKVANGARWKAKTKGCNERMTYHPAGFYYDILAPLTRSVDIWQTAYIHTMVSHQSIVDVIKTTGMKPYLESLADDGERQDFETEVLAEVGKVYSASKDGKVLFPFERLFFIAKK